MTVTQFKYAYLDDASRAENLTGIPAYYLLAQSAIFTKLGTEAYRNNMFLQETTPGYAGKRMLLRTTKIHDKVTVRYPNIYRISPIGNKYLYDVRAFFKVHDTPFESFLEFAQMIKSKYGSFSSNQECIDKLALKGFFDWKNDRNEVSAMLNKLLSAKIAYEEYVTSNKIAFLNELINISIDLEVDPDWLMTTMYAESRLNPKARNPYTKATGLIQFMPSTARGVGTTVDALCNMSNVQQLKYVFRYFRGYKGRITSVYDLYKIVFFPLSLGKPMNWVFQALNLSAGLLARQNKVIDIDQNGYITVAEFHRYVDKHIQEKTA